MPRLAYALGLLTVLSAPALACDGFKPVDADSGNRLMSILESSTAKPLDQIYAFETLACAEQPILRRFAMDEGLRSKNRLLRAQALIELVLQRDGLKVELSDSRDLPEALRNWIKGQGGTIVYRLTKPNRQHACVSLENSGDCEKPTSWQLRVDGERVRLNGNAISGDFALTEERTLRGTVKYSSYPPITAKIDLN